MSAAKAASLTSALLFAKGAASPSGFRAMAPPVLRDTYGKARADMRIRLSIRLDPERHRRLRLALVHLRQHGQDFVVAALDHYLEQVVPTLLANPCRCLGSEETCGECCTSHPFDRLPPPPRT